MRTVIKLFVVWIVWAVLIAALLLATDSSVMVLSDCKHDHVQGPNLHPPAKRRWVTERVEFPFQIRSSDLGSLARDTLIVKESNSVKRFRFSPQLDDAPLQISRVVPWGDALIVWTALERLPWVGMRKDLQYRQFLIRADNQVEAMETHDNFAPWLADSKRDLLFSLEVRSKVMGRQPTEDELPPQRVRIASLKDPSEPAAYFPVRSLEKLFVHSSGDLVVLRWDLQYLQPGSWGAYSLFLDRRNHPTYELLWSTEIAHAEGMTQYGMGPDLQLQYTPDSDRVEISYVKNLRKREEVMTSVALSTGLIQNRAVARPYPPRSSPANCNQGGGIASRI